MKTKIRTRISAAAIAAVLAIGTAFSVYALWSSNITIGGSVSANGKWALKVTAADIDLSNAGASLATKEVVNTPTYDVVTYPVRFNYIEETGYYLYQIDDTAPETKTITEAELSEYTTQIMIPAGSKYYVSGSIPGKLISYKIATNDNFIEGTGTSVKATDGGALNGTVIGTAIAFAYGGSSTAAVEGVDITLTYKQASTYFTQNPVTVKLVDEESIVEDSSVTFASVNFTLPGAWASYKVTITNEGTVNANLSDYQVVTSGLDEEVFTVSVPDLSGDILTPGESCTFNVVVQVVADSDFSADAQPFTISLTYAQDSVNEAPAASHTH